MKNQSPLSPSSVSTPSCIQEYVSLADKCWFKTGGPARYFAEPHDDAAWHEALHYAQRLDIPIFILGEGANILISDTGFNGLVIRPQSKSLSHHIEENNNAYVTAGAGVSMPDLIEYCLNHQMLGLEEFSGIPGTVGGSVYINLHYFQFLLAQFIEHARVIERTTGIISTVTPDWFDFGYNSSRLHDESCYLLDATFKLRFASDLETAYARGRRAEIIRHRTSRYPNKNTCGSFFRNFLEHEVALESNGKKMIFIAYYLDKIGVKGALSHGGASVSYQHANMLVTNDQATSSDVIALASEMQQRVYDQFGIIPQPECRLVGFSEYPLLQ